MNINRTSIVDACFPVLIALACAAIGLLSVIGEPGRDAVGWACVGLGAIVGLGLAELDLPKRHGWDPILRLVGAILASVGTFMVGIETSGDFATRAKTAGILCGLIAGATIAIILLVKSIRAPFTRPGSGPGRPSPKSGRRESFTRRS